VKRNWSNFNLTDTIYQSNNRTVDETDPITKEQLEEYQIASEVILPIWIRALDSEAVFQTYLWGLLVVHHQTPRQWKQKEIDILKQFADYLTISIQLEQLAVVDYLTRLSNRRYFNSKIQQEWRRLSREEKTLSLILCDVDHFSSYNKTYGHLAGDECLKKIAGVLTGFARRPADLVARYGGEEFALILPNTELQGAMKVAENIRSQVRALGIENANSSYGYVTISIGVACQIPNRNFPPDILIQAADEAMFQAKKNGRNRVYCEAIQG
jgi:diguanylate cyclase (GGDEF)-like protein